MHFNAMPVSIRGTVYPSQAEAAKAMGVVPSAISQRLRVRGSADTVGLGLGGGSRGNTNTSKELKIFGHTFPSRKQAAKELRISRNQLHHWISDKASDAQKQMLLAAVMAYQLRLERSAGRV